MTPSDIYWFEVHSTSHPGSFTCRMHFSTSNLLEHLRLLPCSWVHMQRWLPRFKSSNCSIKSNHKLNNLIESLQVWLSGMRSRKRRLIQRDKTTRYMYSVAQCYQRGEKKVIIFTLQQPCSICVLLLWNSARHFLGASEPCRNDLVWSPCCMWE